jgi:hypothetical protein
MNPNMVANRDIVMHRLEVMKTLMYMSEFGSMLYDKLAPTDISSFMHAFYLSLMPSQKIKYMQVWREFFVDKSWIEKMYMLGYEIEFVGIDLVMLVGQIMNPNTRTTGSRIKNVDMFVIKRELPYTQWIAGDSVIETLTVRANEIKSPIGSLYLPPSVLRYGIRLMHTVCDDDESDDEDPDLCMYHLTVRSATTYDATIETYDVSFGGGTHHPESVPDFVATLPAMLTSMQRIAHRHFPMNPDNDSFVGVRLRVHKTEDMYDIVYKGIDEFPDMYSLKVTHMKDVVNVFWPTNVASVVNASSLRFSKMGL